MKNQATKTYPTPETWEKMTLEKATNYTVTKANGMTNSLLDTAVIRAMTGKDYPSILNFSKEQRYNIDVLQELRTKGYEILTKLNTSRATERDMEYGMKYLPITQWDKLSRLETMTEGMLVKFLSRRLSRYGAMAILKQSDKVNSLILDAPFRGEETDGTLGSMLEDLRSRIDADPALLLLDVQSMLTEKQLKTFYALASGLTQREITKATGISPSTQAHVKRVIWEYLYPSNKK